MKNAHHFFWIVILGLLGIAGAEAGVIYYNADLPSELLQRDIKIASLENTLKGEEGRTRYALGMATEANRNLFKSVGQCFQRAAENLEHLDGAAKILEREWKIELARACQK